MLCRKTNDTNTIMIMIAQVDSGKSVTIVYNRLGTIPALDKQTALMKQYRAVHAMHADAR